MLTGESNAVLDATVVALCVEGELVGQFASRTAGVVDFLEAFFYEENAKFIEGSFTDIRVHQPFKKAETCRPTQAQFRVLIFPCNC